MTLEPCTTWLLPSERKIDFNDKHYGSDNT
jgi:hypothetical protein